MESRLIRQFDETGRVIIPKEVRETLGFDGQSLAIEPLEDDLGVTVSAAKETESQEYLETLDDDGRLLIPSELRRQFGWEKGKRLEVAIKNKRAVLREQTRHCEICGITDSLLEVRQAYLCEECLGLGNKELVGRWRNILNQLMEEYHSYCERRLSFQDDEDVHQARVIGRKLRTLLEFLGVDKNHEIPVRIKQVHKQLSKVREADVLIDAFTERAKQKKNSDYAGVYREIAEKVGSKRQKSQQKLGKNLPDIVDDEFTHQWKLFLKEELSGYVLTLDLDKRISQYEHQFNQFVKNYKRIAGEEGEKSEAVMKSLHLVRIQSKGLRYIYSYLNEIPNKEYQNRAEHYKNFQQQFGDINDLQDWLNQVDNYKKKLEASKKDIQQVRKKLRKDLYDLVNEVDLAIK